MKSEAFIFICALVMFAVASYGVNFYKLINCDFEAPYKCEIVHTVGVFVPPTFLVTAWVCGEGKE